MSAPNTHSRRTVAPRYTSEEWTHRIQHLQETIYAPALYETSPTPSDMYGQSHCSNASTEGHVPRVVNTDSRAPSHNSRSNHATGSRRSPYSEFPQIDTRKSYSASYSHEAVDNIRPRYRSQFDVNSPPAEFDTEYEEDSGYMSGERDGLGREERKGYHHNNGEVMFPHSSAYDTRRLSGYGASPSHNNSRSAGAPLRGILRNKSTPGSTQHDLPYEGGYFEGFHEDGNYRGRRMEDARDTREDHRGEPHSAVTPIISRGTPYTMRPRRLSDGGPLTDRLAAHAASQPEGYQSRPPSVFDGPVIPGQTTVLPRPDGLRSRPSSSYGSPVAPAFQGQNSPLDIEVSARSTSRPVSSLEQQTYSAGASYGQHSRRASAASSPSAWNAPQLSTAHPGFRGGREPRRIFFYQKGEPYYGFTNFSPHSVIYNGKQYPTSEHLFQSFKFHDYRPDLAERIRICSQYPGSALAEARRLADQQRPDWFEVNKAKMYETLRLKFSQHLGLRAELIETGEAILIEESEQDSFWGCGPDGKGRNELGQALMKLREELRRLS